MNADGSNVQRLTYNNYSSDTGPAWCCQPAQPPTSSPKPTPAPDPTDEGTFVIYAILLLVVTLMIIQIYRMSTRIKRLEKKKEKTEPKVSKTIVCPLCKNEIQEDWAACPHCGARLKDETRIY